MMKRSTVKQTVILKRARNNCLVLRIERCLEVYQVENANVVDANALAIEIIEQFNRVGSTTTSSSKIITDVNAIVFDIDNAVK